MPLAIGSVLMTTLTIGGGSLPAWAVLSLLAGAVLLVLLAVLAAVLESRTRRRLVRELAASQRATEELRARLDDLERREHRAAAVRDEREYVITSMGTPVRADEAPVALSAPAFADAVVRESVVHAASFVYGVRRALSPEVRNRIRFEMKREAKRARKARRVEVKEALREYRARHRADVPADAEVVL
jgi:hypothetical protein